MLGSRTRHLAEDPSDTVTLVETITLYHMIIEGMLALTGQHFIIDYNEREGVLPGFVEGFNLIARDEHRHVAFGARFCATWRTRTPSTRKRSSARWRRGAAGGGQGALPPWAEGKEDYEIFGVSLEETRLFAAQALSRRLKVIGLMPASARWQSIKGLCHCCDWATSSSASGDATSSHVMSPALMSERGADVRVLEEPADVLASVSGGRVRVLLLESPLPSDSEHSRTAKHP